MQRGIAITGVLTLVIAVIFVAGCKSPQTPTDPQGSAQLLNPSPAKSDGGFNEFGYNYNARLFNGKADGVDKNLDGKVWGDPTYANDKLVMKWNDEWDRGNTENWNSPPYDAWTSNEWNGAGKGGSGDVWHYKIIWVGTDLETSQYWRDGGYAIWGQFEVIMDQGTTSNEHFWYAHGKSTGYHIFP
jgi:hypothetical protein